MSNLELRQVVKRYGDLTAVSNISFEVKEGELLVVLGPPGAGKSSTLKMVAGVEPVTSGEILIDGEKVNDIEPSNRDVAMAFETYALYPHLTVEQNIAFPLKSPKRAGLFSVVEINDKVHKITKLLQIDMLLDRKPKELSGGQRQRVSLGRCLVRDPKLFLLDEPIAHLDAKLRHILRRELKEWLKKKKACIIYTTTDYLEAFSLADRILVLHKGVIQQIGSWADIYNNPANSFIGTLISDPPMNYFKGEIVSADGKLLFISKDNTFAIEEELQEMLMRSEGKKNVLMGIFPSKIHTSKRTVAGEKGETVLQAKVEFTEIRGARKIVFLEASNKLTFTAQLPIEEDVKDGERLNCLFRGCDMQIYEQESGRNIIYR